MTQHITNFLDNLQNQSGLAKLFLPMIFLLIIVITIIFFFNGFTNLVLVVAAMLAFYLAVNIGANDVANNLGPAVGAKAISIG
jgi:PiT family inorganic phosphate transporter